jgi:NADH-ubiquinone oxidoreductase chain 2
LAISLAITIFSFAGIPPFVGFFAKQMVLSAALQNGYVFMALIGVITSVISAVYYLNIVKIMFFDNHSYNNKFNEIFKGTYLHDVNYLNKSNFPLSSSLSITISIFTLIILFFMFMPDQ